MFSRPPEGTLLEENSGKEIRILSLIIFNKSFEDGRFPEMLKIAKVIPIFKGENPTNPNNYRPISLLSIFDKLLENVMYNRVNAFQTKHKIFY